MSVGSKDVHVTFQYRNYSTKLNKVETVNINFILTCRVWETAYSDLYFGSHIKEKMRPTLFDALTVLLEIAIKLVNV